MEAKQISLALLEERLVANTMIIENASSFHMWDEIMKEQSESILLCKTKDSLISTAIDKIKAMHSYECPCIITIPITGGSQSYLNLIIELME